jgi:lipoprotein-releasing system permease protein
MNGFQKEVRDRMLSVVAHVEVYDAGRRRPWPTGRHRWPSCKRQPAAVIGAAPFVAAQALLARGDDDARRDGARHRPRAGGQVTAAGRQLKNTLLKRLQPGDWHVVLGASWRASWACACRRRGDADRPPAAR